MHLLHLLRHAKSGRDEDVDDRDRTLSKRGREAARAIGKGLPKALGSVDLVLCSSSARTRETADLVLAAFDRPPSVLFEDGLYLVAEGALLRRLRRLEESCGSVVVIGHNPGLHQLAVALAAPTSPKFKALAEGKFPTTARASLRIDTNWAALDRGRNPLVAYVTPKSLGIED
jgi:phosphohistidine phosphatase